MPMHIVTTHMSADLDGLAAMVAARRLYREPLELVLPAGLDLPTRRFWEAEGAGSPDDFPPLLGRAAAEARLAQEGLGRLVVVDTGRAARVGWLGPWLDRASRVEVWDTHAGTSDWPRVRTPPAGATISPMVLELAARTQQPSPREAGLMLLGIHSDTGHLRYAGTTPVDHRAAAICLEWGADLGWLELYLPDGLDRQQARILGELAEAMERIDVGTGWAALLTLEHDGRVSDLGTLLTRLRVGEGWPAALLLAAEEGRITVIGRSDGSVDVGTICARLGGGGHPEAAAASLRGVTLSEARARLRDAVWASRVPVTAAALCSRRLFTLAAGASVEDADAALNRYRINALPLVDAAGAVVGVVSRREVDEARRHGMAHEPAQAVSIGPPPVVPPEAGLETLRRVLLDSPSRLLVVGTLSAPQGVITRTGVFRATHADPPLATGARSRTEPPEALWARAGRMLSPPVLAQVAAVGDIAAEVGVRALLVGGCVRDILLDRPSRDVDIVVAGDAAALGRAVAARLGGSVQAHETFGTAHWITRDGLEIDLASARTESYAAPGALPAVAPGDLRQDVHRRDFTINMLAMGILPDERGVLIDPYGGRADLEQGTLRVVHGLSFYDDPTRAWRAARFAARLDLRLAPGTAALLREALRVGVLDRVTDERLGAELHRIFREAQVVGAVARLRDWGLLRRIHPGLPSDRGLLDRLAAVREAWSALRAVLADDEREVESAAEALWLALGWALPDGERRDTERLVAGARGRARRWLLGPRRCQDAVRALAAPTPPRSAQARALEKLDVPELIAVQAHLPAEVDAVSWWLGVGRAVRCAVDGEALLAAGVPRGPGLGVGIAAARAAAYDGADADEQRRIALQAARQG